MPDRADKTEDGWRGVQGLDRLLEHRVRLATCVLLSRNDALSFSRLKQLLQETDGSLGTHLRKLEEAGYAKVRKAFVDRKPVSWYSLTASGRRALQAHTETLERIIREVPLDEGG